MCDVSRLAVSGIGCKGSIEFDWRDVTAVFVEAVMIEPVGSARVANSMSSMDRARACRV
jgi:hypothetical protein